MPSAQSVPLARVIGSRAARTRRPPVRSCSLLAAASTSSKQAPVAPELRRVGARPLLPPRAPPRRIAPGRSPAPPAPTARCARRLPRRARRPRPAWHRAGQRTPARGRARRRVSGRRRARGSCRSPARTASSSATSDAAASSSPANTCATACVCSVRGSTLERTGGAGHLDVTGRQDRPAFVVPQLGGFDRREPEPAQSLLHGEVVAPECAHRSLPDRLRGGVAVRVQRGHAVEQEVDHARPSRRRRQPARGSRHTRPLRPIGERRGRERLQIRRARECIVERLEPARCGEQQRHRLAAVAGSGAEANAIGRAAGRYARAATFVERRLLGGGKQDERLLERAGAQHRLRGGQRAHPAPGRVRSQCRRSLQERRRRGQAPARLRPCRPSARARRPPPRRDPRPRGRDATRGDPDPAADRSRRRARDGHRVARARPRPGRRLSAPADVETARARRSRPGLPPGPVPPPPARCRAARRRATATSRRRPALPPPAGGARRVSAGSGSSCRTKPCSMRLVSGISPGSPNPPATAIAASARAAARAARAGCRRPRRGSDPAPARRAAREASRPAASRASSAASPSITSSGNPSSSCSSPDSRSANTSPTRSAKSRRATNASVCADTRSSHCASSTMHTSGCSSAASANRLRTATPTRKRSGGGPALRPNAVLSASRCGPGRRGRRPSIVRAQRMQAGECELHLRLDACRPDDPASLRGCRQMPQQSGLADSRLAAEDQHTALALAYVRDESLQHGALADAVDQPRCRQVGVEHAALQSQANVLRTLPRAAQL